MALIKCHECGKQIAATATDCPGCGASLVTDGEAAVGGCLSLVIWIPMLCVAMVIFLVVYDFIFPSQQAMDMFCGSLLEFLCPK